jgi:hypothetical protein
MKNILLVSLFLFSFSAFSQNDEARVDSLVTDFKKNLVERDISTFLVTKRYCMGEINIFKLGDEKICTSKSTYYAVYVFWQEEGKSMVKKIDNCGFYISLEAPDNMVLDFMEQHGQDIQQHPIKPYEIASKESGPIKSTETYPCSRVLTYVSPSLNIDQQFALFDLTNDALEDNINYAYNNGLKALELEEVLARAISQVDDNFRRH